MIKGYLTDDEPLSVISVEHAPDLDEVNIFVYAETQNHGFDVILLTMPAKHAISLMAKIGEKVVV